MRPRRDHFAARPPFAGHAGTVAHATIIELGRARRRAPFSVNDNKAASSEGTLDTTRLRLNRIRRVTGFFTVTGSLSFFASVPIFSWSLRVGCVLLAISLVFNPIGLIIRALAGRCGHCRRRISRALCFDGWPWRISPAIRFCPYCAASIDEPFPKTRDA